MPVGVRRDGTTLRPNTHFLDPVLDWLAGSDPAAVPRLLLEDRVSRASADDKTMLAAVRT